MGYRATQIRKPANETEFEKACVILFKEILNDPDVKRLGTRGQRQHGVDIIGHRNREPNHIVGIQCKLKSGSRKLTATEVRTEVADALTYEPCLQEYYIVTTAKDDTSLVQLTQQLMLEQEAAGRLLTIEVWGWDTLTERIDQFESAKNAFDPGFSPSVAAQDRKLDVLIEGQRQAATQNQVAQLARKLDTISREASTRLPGAFADRQLQKVLSRILRRRGFAGTDVAAELATLAERAIDGDLSLGSDTVRAEVCNRAARANATGDSSTAAVRFRRYAERLDPGQDLFLADALLKQADGEIDASLQMLRTRSDRDSRSALFNALVAHRGQDAALAWVRAQGLGPADFNPAGTINLVLKMLDTGDFDHALATIEQTPDEYFDQCPVLRLLRVQLLLGSVLPADRKTILLQGLPLNPRTLELAAGPESQQRIRAAREDLSALLKAIDDLDLGDFEQFLSEFDLWLRLEDVTTHDAARAQLAVQIAAPEVTLHRVRLALAYKVPFNQEALQRHLFAQREIGGWTTDERFAAFLIAYHTDDPETISAFFDKHHDDLFAQTDLARAALAAIEIESLARSGRFAEARQHLALHRRVDLMSEQAIDLERIIVHIEQGDEAEALRRRYSQSKSLIDLRLLVTKLREDRDSHDLAVYAPILARETKTADAFDLAIKALAKAKQHAEVLALIEDLPDAYELNDEYIAVKGWTHYALAQVLDARAAARTLLARRDVATDRELAIITAIETGDWGYVQAILTREVGRLDTLAPKDLIRMARLALEVDSPYVDAFRDAALRQAPDDPEVNLAAFLLATERSDDPRSAEADGWFRKAIERSGAEGPVHSASIRELVDQIPNWKERTDKVDRLLREAEAPLFVAARTVRRQLMDLTFGQALRNTDADEHRLKYPLFAFSGAQPLREVGGGASSVAFDVTALVTLDYLGLLEKALASFERPIIAPNTLSMLFLERQFLKIRQPSERVRAARIQDLLASGRLKVVSHAPGADSRLSGEIDSELQALLSAARRDGGLVVRTAPVFKLGSFLEATVDMDAHASVLTDSISVVSFLASSGQIDATRRKTAEAYLRHVDKGWEKPSAIDASTPLYLDDLALTYLDYVGLLEPLTRSVVAVFVHISVDLQTRTVLRHAKHSLASVSAIERIAGVVNKGIEAGHIRFSARRAEGEEPDGSTEPLFESSPTLDLLADLSDIDIVVADDRGLNKLQSWEDDSGNKADSSSVLDILAFLRSTGALDDEGYWRARHQLRAAGFYAVPLESAELRHHLSATPVANGLVVETPELRAVRESIVLPRINSCFIPAEIVWLDGVRLAILDAIRQLWLHLADLARVQALSTWLISILPNPMEWCLTPESDASWAAARHQAAGQAVVTMLFVTASDERRDRYFAWLQEQVLTPLQTSRPDIWHLALGLLKSYLPKLLEPDADEPRAELKQAVLPAVIDALPTSLRGELLSDKAFCDGLGLVPKFSISLGDNLQVDAESLHKVLRAAIAGRNSALLTLRDGARKRVKLERHRGGKVTIFLGKAGFSFSHADLLADDRKTRMRALRRVLAARPLLSHEEDNWRSLIGDGPLIDRDYMELMTALSTTPEDVRSRIANTRQFGAEMLVPDEPRYYERLVGPLDKVSDVDTYLAVGLSDARTALQKRHPRKGLRRIAFSALWRPLIPFDLLRSVDIADVRRLLKSEDPFSLLLGFELCCDRLADDAGVADLGLNFLDKLLLDRSASSDRCNIFSALALISTIKVRQALREATAPLFWVRLASLAHAGVLADALGGMAQSERFLKWSTENFYPTYVWHTIIDRRDSPTWRPDWIDPEHIYAELVGRVQLAILALGEKDRPAEWLSALDAALDRLTESGHLPAAFFPGPFDDFRQVETPPSIEAIREIEAKLAAASTLCEVPGLFGITYAMQPSERIVAAIVRILSQAGDQFIADQGQALQYLQLCSHIAASARATDLANVVINQCFIELRRSGPAICATDLFLVMAEACAAHSDHKAHRDLLGATASRLCFALEEKGDLTNVGAVLDVLGTRDERLVPALAKAQEIIRTKSRRAEPPSPLLR